jgi:uncharacterized membrane protein required for colicin V production
MSFTIFDFLILLALLVGAAIGFFRGLLRQASLTAMLYVSIVVAAFFYRGVSRFLIRVTGQAGQAADVLGFFVLMGLVLAGLFVLVYELRRNVDMDRFSVWHNIVGMVFGFINATIVCSIVLIVLRSAAGGASWYAYGGVQRFLQQQLARSWMVYVFRPLNQLLLALIEPIFVRRPLPPLLRNAL